MRTFRKDIHKVVVENSGWVWVLIDGRDMSVTDEGSWYNTLLNFPQFYAEPPLNYQPMTAANAPAPQIVTQSSQVSTTYAAWNIFRTGTGTFWRTNNYVANASGSTGEERVMLELGPNSWENGKGLSKIGIMISALINAPKDFELRGYMADDENYYDTLLQVFDETWSTANETKYYEAQDVYNNFWKRYRRFAFICTRIQGTTATFLSLQRLYLHDQRKMLIDSMDALGSRLLVKSHMY
ncbi:MAG: hypothetical protein LBQ75_09365 [Zoogloeaceae bacterium]|nr:hypothetical protein [Zoogloeaceae bacterium]